MISYALYSIIFLVSDNNQFLTLEVRWKPAKFVGSTALATQTTHPHTCVCPRPCALYSQNSYQCSKVAEVSYSISSSKFDICKCINLNSVFTLILIYYYSMPYLFQGDEKVNSYFKFLLRTLTFSVLLPEKCLFTLLKFIWNIKNKHWEYLHLTLYSQSKNRCYIQFFEFLVYL